VPQFIKVRPQRWAAPRDKAKVEVAVLIIERWLLGRLRHRRFYSLAELNAAIGELLRQLNDERPIRRLGVTRRTLFEDLDRPNLKFRAGGDRQPADRAGWRQSQASAGTREGQLTDHPVASLAAHENFTGLVAHQNRLILPASAPQQRYFIAHQNPLPRPFLE
jgi:hypothetical protein